MALYTIVIYTGMSLRFNKKKPEKLLPTPRVAKAKFQKIFSEL